MKMQIAMHFSRLARNFGYTYIFTLPTYDTAKPR